MDVLGELRLNPEIRRTLRGIPDLTLLLSWISMGSNTVTAFLTFICYPLLWAKLYILAIPIYYIAVVSIIVSFLTLLIGRQLTGWLRKPLCMSENFQLLLVAFLWLLTPPSFFKLLPFGTYAAINMFNYFVTYVVSPRNELVMAGAPLFRYLQVWALALMLHYEIFVCPMALFMDFCLCGSSLWPWCVYMGILFMRMGTLMALKSAIYLMLNWISLIIEQPSTPYDVIHNWRVFRRWIARVCPLDLNVFLFGSLDWLGVKKFPRHHRRMEGLGKPVWSRKPKFEADDNASILWRGAKWQ